MEKDIFLPVPDSCMQWMVTGNVTFGWSCIHAMLYSVYKVQLYMGFETISDWQKHKMHGLHSTQFQHIQVFIKCVQRNVGKKWISKLNRKLIFVITFLLSNYKHSHLNIVHYVQDWLI